MGGPMDKLLYPGIPTEPELQFPAPVEGKCKQVTAKGIMFTLENFPGQVFGPAKWARTLLEPTTAPGDPGSHDHEGTAPPVGADVLVLFAGSGIGKPWVVAWWTP